MSLQNDEGVYVSPSRKPFVSSGHRDRHRFGYYDALVRHSGGELSLQPPKHVIPPELFLVGGSATQSELITVLSLLNVTIGSTILVLPHAAQQAGILGTLLLLVVIGLACSYTSWLIVAHANGLGAFERVCRARLGQPGYEVAWWTALLLLIGGIGANFIFLGNAAEALLALIGLRSSISSGLILCAAMFLLAQMQVRRLMRANALGSICIVYVLLFGVGASFQRRPDVLASLSSLPLFGPRPSTLAGVLPISFLTHAAVLAITAGMVDKRPPVSRIGSEPPLRVRRAILIASCLAITIYAVFGLVCWAAFDTPGQPLRQDFLQEFARNNVLALVARGALLVQLMLVVLLFMHVVREMLAARLDLPNDSLYFDSFLNLSMLGLGFVSFNWASQQVGLIISYQGSILGVVFEFLLPALVAIRAPLANTATRITCVAIILLGLANTVFQAVASVE